VAVSGEVDMATAPQLSACLRSHTDQDITVDLSGVGFLDSSGLNALVHAYKLLLAAGHTLRTTGEADHILKIMDTTGLTKMLHGEDPDT
jgi:anti-sigma B factor antagonist